jgi:hypothetical protein
MVPGPHPAQGNPHGRTGNRERPRYRVRSSGSRSASTCPSSWSWHCWASSRCPVLAICSCAGHHSLAVLVHDWPCPRRPTCRRQPPDRLDRFRRCHHLLAAETAVPVALVGISLAGPGAGSWSVVCCSPDTGSGELIWTTAAGNGPRCSSESGPAWAGAWSTVAVLPLDGGQILGSCCPAVSRSAPDAPPCCHWPRRPAGTPVAVVLHQVFLGVFLVLFAVNNWSELRSRRRGPPLPSPGTGRPPAALAGTL